MKTKELIRRLQEADPSGEVECFIGGDDIFSVESEPFYYDGRPTLLIRDPAKAPYYDVVGVRFADENHKVVLSSMSWKVAMADNMDLKAVYDTDELRNRYQPDVELYRVKVKKFDDRLALECMKNPPLHIKIRTWFFRLFKIYDTIE